MKDITYWSSHEEKEILRPLSMDVKFQNHFKKLQQVFLYITDECNLRCKHCLYKANLILGKSIDTMLAARLLTTFRKMGAYKLTFIGGEATLYGKEDNSRPLFALIKHARDLGYEYIRLDTNGHFDKRLLSSADFLSLNELSFSIDGYDSKTNDSLRGQGAFYKTLENLRNAIKKGMNVHITSCVARQNLDIAGSASKLMDRIIQFAENEGAKAMNFHGVFKMGVPMDTWTDGTHITADEWIKAYKTILERMDKHAYLIPVRLPTHVISKEEFNRKPENYGYCPGKLGERVLIHPNGIIRICSSLLCTPFGVAKYDFENISWENITNELIHHNFSMPTPCTNQKAVYDDKHVPVCFSFKPKQKEPVWEKFGKSVTDEFFSRVSKDDFSALEVTGQTK